MKRHYPEDHEKSARDALIKKQARTDPVCAEYIAQQATLAQLGGGFAFIPTQLDMEDEDDDFRPF